ncbi:MAG: GvpL/GvpF family gas vesicle protein [Gloeotrichia echinulata IR180]|jgi:hypothetical protein|nr:GvpL/GvpF family gas vesicle protein [Gloeotrichia echinulata DEX184]
MKTHNIYTYAFVKTPDFPLDLPDGNTGQVRLINGGGISAIVESGTTIESVQKNDEEVIKMVLAHDRVICELFDQITVLPLRFGTYFISQEALLDHIETNAKEYQEKINQFHGKNEYLLKLIPRTLPEPVKASVAGGRDYFLAKKQYYENQKIFQIAQADEKYSLIHLITELYKSSVIVQHQAEEVRIYLLVSYQDKSLLSKQFLTWQEACPRWDLFLGEGLPPYQFI